MSHHLTTYLNENWQREVENVRQAATCLWERPAHHHAVDQGLAHADRVVALLDGLTEGLMTRSNHPLTQEEIYALLAATYLHAIGLQDEHSEPNPDVRWARYPELGAEMIYRTIELPEQAVHLAITKDCSLVEITARVVAGHRETVYPSPDYDDLVLGNSIVRPRLLVALLHFADSLDLSYRRVDMEQLKLMSASSDEALDWWLHYYVNGVQVADEFVRVGYRVPIGNVAYEKLLPELVESKLRTDFDSLRDTFRLYGVRIDIGSSAITPMRAVEPMPAGVWTAVECRIAQLQGIKTAQVAIFSPLLWKVYGLLTTMGYDCELPTCDGPFAYFRCRPLWGECRSPLLIGCKIGPVEVTDVELIITQLEGTDQHGYLIAETRVLPSAREVARASGKVQVITLAGFYNELLNFRAYVEKLVADYEESELADYYVDLGCIRYSYDEQGQVVGWDRHKPMDDYVDGWLRARGAGGERNHISILGDCGTGKTSFCRQYAAKQGRRWLADPERERIPILINLRDYTKTLEVRTLISDLLANQYGIHGATFESFSRYNADGMLLILLDGFDEMAHGNSQRRAVDNFWELAKVVVPGSKIILTCHPRYFGTHRGVKTLPRGQHVQLPKSTQLPGGSGGYIYLRDHSNFEIVHLEPYSDNDIQALLQARFPDRWHAYWAQIQRVYNLPDLTRWPGLVDMIAHALPALKEDQTINVTWLYQAYTDFWLERDVARGRTLLTAADRRLFAEELAMEMLRSGELAVHYRRILNRVKSHFPLEGAEEVDYLDNVTLDKCSTKSPHSWPIWDT